jgi:hypothetical protein
MATTRGIAQLDGDSGWSTINLWELARVILRANFLLSGFRRFGIS